MMEQTLLVINKDEIRQQLIAFLDTIFSLPEIKAAKIREHQIYSVDDHDTIDLCMNDSYHDVLSDLDLSVIVKLSPHDYENQEHYMKAIHRYGITRENCLGIAYVPESKMYRIIKKNGMRYDFGFCFELDQEAKDLNLTLEQEEDSPITLTQADRFFFIEIQALAKLYRGDYLIADHLSNMLINETLVAQMIQRDLKYGTKFHRYGHKETLEYELIKPVNPWYITGDATFDQIADKLYKAAITYDKLIPQLNANYTKRSDDLFRIWQVYHNQRND